MLKKNLLYEFNTIIFCKLEYELISKKYNNNVIYILTIFFILF